MSDQSSHTSLSDQSTTRLPGSIPPPVATPLPTPVPEPPKAKAERWATKALDLIARTMEDEEAPQSLRVRCAEQILDRAWGKPTQYVEQEVKVLTYQDLLTNIQVADEKFTAIEAQVVEVKAIEQKPEPINWKALM